MIHKIYLQKKQDRLGNRNNMRRATGEPESTLLTTEYLVFRSQRWNRRMHDDKIRSQSWSRCSRNISMRNNSSKTWVRSRRSTSSARNHNNYSSTWTTQRSSNFVRILQNINVLIAMPSPKSGWRNLKYKGSRQHSKRPIAMLLQSLALSLRRTPFDDQNTVHLKDRWSFSRRRRCLRKQGKKRGSHPTILSRWYA